MPTRGERHAPSRRNSRRRSSRWPPFPPRRMTRRKGRHKGKRRARAPRRTQSRWRPSKPPKRYPIPCARYTCRRPSCARKPRSPPISASPSGWCGSGPTISAFRPTGFRACPVPMNAKPFALTRSAASSISCWPPKAIRRCWFISTISVRWGRTQSPAPTAAAASTRILRARSWSCISSVCAPATPRMMSSASPTF